MPDVILPVLDEAGAIPTVLARMPPGYDPIVVDNGSTDGSASVARGLGARVVFETRRVPLHARLANAALTTEINRRTGVQMSDLGPMRAARRDAVLALGLRDRRFGWSLEMAVRAARSGWRIREVPVLYSPRVGRSKVTGTVRGSLRTARDMARVLKTEGAS